MSYPKQCQCGCGMNIPLTRSPRAHFVNRSHYMKWYAKNYPEATPEYLGHLHKCPKCGKYGALTARHSWNGTLIGFEIRHFTYGWEGKKYAAERAMNPKATEHEIRKKTHCSKTLNAGACYFRVGQETKLKALLCHKNGSVHSP